jgi:hypothetical protein
VPAPSEQVVDVVRTILQESADCKSILYMSVLVSISPGWCDFPLAVYTPLLRGVCRRRRGLSRSFGSPLGFQGRYLRAHLMAKIRAPTPCVCPYPHPATPLERSAPLELLARRDAGACNSRMLCLSASLPKLRRVVPLTSSVSCAARCANGRTSTTKTTVNKQKPFAALVMTPWSQANMASSYRRVVRSQRAVE